MTLVKGDAIPGVPIELGAEFEPAGLVFAVPAKVTMQFGEVYQPRASLHWTSPFTALPLLDDETGRVDVKTAFVTHFSGFGTSAANLILVAIIKGQIAAAINQPGDLGLFDMAAILAGVTFLQKINQDQGVDLVALAAKVKISLQHWVQSHCDDDVKHPHDFMAALYYQVGRISLAIGADVPEAIDCGDRIRIALCNQSCGFGEKCYSVGGEIPGTCCREAHCGDGFDAAEPACGDRIATENCGVPIDCGACKTGETCIDKRRCQPKPCETATAAAISAYTAPNQPCGPWGASLEFTGTDGVTYCVPDMDLGPCPGNAYLCSTATGLNGQCSYSCDATTCPFDADFFCSNGHCCDAASCLF
jgi:hypothetical protein